MRVAQQSLVSRVHRARSRLFDYGAATLGPIIGSVAQFLLSIEMMHALSPTNFGQFAFVLVLCQFGISISSAAFCAPLPIIIRPDRDTCYHTESKGLFAANFLYCCAGLVFFFASSLALGLSQTAAFLFGLYGGVALLRWFARAYGYATVAMTRTIASDLVYGFVLFLCSVIIWLKGTDDAVDAGMALLVSTSVALLPFGAAYFRAQFRDVNLSDARYYETVWNAHARWSLVGVVTTDATANAHAYIVTALAGPAAFAPLAATALLIRPIGVLMSALGDYERARLARAFGTDMNAHKLRNSVLLIWFTLFAGWLGSAAMTAILLTIVPHLFFSMSYPQSDLVVGAVLWLAIAAVKCWRAPESIFLQATGRFKALAHASLISCWVSIVCVLVALLLCGPFGSLVGVIIGEIVFAFWIARSARIWETIRDM